MSRGLVMLSLALLALSVGPYLQLVAPDSITVVWWSENDTLGTLEWGLSERYGEPVSSSPEAFHHVPGFRHEVRIAGLRPNTLYFYRVVQGESVEGRTSPVCGSSDRAGCSSFANSSPTAIIAVGYEDDAPRTDPHSCS